MGGAGERTGEGKGAQGIPVSLALPRRRQQKFTFKHNLYKLREERDIKPSSFGQLVSATLYERRFGPYFCQPVIAGLEADGTPYLCGMDSIGAIETAKDFMVAGTATESLLGVCESLWKPDMVRAAAGRGGGAAGGRTLLVWWQPGVQ